jgi:hypothetical protein
MISENYKKQIQETQDFRNTLLGDGAFSRDELNGADSILTKILSDTNNEKFVIEPIMDHPYLKYGLGFSYGWYSKNAQFRNPETILPRSSKARVVLFREYFILSQFVIDPWRIIEQVCDIQALKDYALSGCKSMNLETNQFFLHSLHTVKRLSEEEYNNIDKSDKAAILYPMYEGEVIAAIVAILASVLGAEYTIWRNKIREKRKLEFDEKIDRLENIISRQNIIIEELLLETKVREEKLIKLITDEKGTVFPRRLQEIYLDDYLPILERLRKSQGKDIPNDLREAKHDAKKYADRITPILCNGKTNDGRLCKRLVTKGAEYCWQHNIDSTNNDH